jgi:hypothetical protein
MEIDELRKKYAEYEKKDKLPSFEKLNNDFEIDKIERDSEMILRTIRKAMMDKIVNSMGFVEMLLNPANAPRMYYAYLKGITTEDRDEIEKIYSIFSDLVISSLGLEIQTSEKTEADLIKTISIKWDEVRPMFLKIIENIKKPNITTRKEKSYFG